MLATETAVTASECVDPETPPQTVMVTTLYELISALNEQVEPGEEDLVTAAVVHLCNTHRLRFLGVPGTCKVVYDQ